MRRGTRPTVAGSFIAVAVTILALAVPGARAGAAPTTRTVATVPAGDAQFQKVADTGASFVTQGAQLVRFGTYPNWVYKTVTGGGACTVAAFGSDPAPWLSKECDVAVTWTTVAKQGSKAVLPVSPQIVRYGSGTTWVQKVVTTGTACTNTVFTNPLPHVAKQCQVRSGPAAQMPMTGKMGPQVQVAFPLTAPGDGNRLESTTWYDPTSNGYWFNPLTSQAAPGCTAVSDTCSYGSPAPGCTVAGPHCAQQDALTTAPSDLGAFRITCDFAKMAYDDPIVAPGRPGAAHLHTFFGNVGVNADSTAANLLNSGNSTCSGGTLNRSSYWVPAIVDTATGQAQIPSQNAVYYKGTYDFLASAGLAQPIPDGLRMVTGSAANTDPTTSAARYTCSGQGGANTGWHPTITDAVTAAGGYCAPGSDFVMNISFPYCWDGTNLDSADHKSHMARAVQLAGDASPHCPADHPVVLPQLTYNVHYTVPYAGAVSNWRLSSDAPGAAAGTSGHADYFADWDATTMKTFVSHCLNAYRDCHDDLLGDGTTLDNPSS